MTGPVLLSLSGSCFFQFFITLFVFWSVRQIKVAVRRLLGACKCSVSYRIVSILSFDKGSQVQARQRNVITELFFSKFYT